MGHRIYQTLHIPHLYLEGERSISLLFSKKSNLSSSRLCEKFNFCHGSHPMLHAALPCMPPLPHVNVLVDSAPPPTQPPTVRSRETSNCPDRRGRAGGQRNPKYPRTGNGDGPGPGIDRSYYPARIGRSDAPRGAIRRTSSCRTASSPRSCFHSVCAPIAFSLDTATGSSTRFRISRDTIRDLVSWGSENGQV